MFSVLLKALSSFVFPQFCETCGKTCDQFICKNCYQDLRFYEEKFKCIRCLAEIDEENALCLSCKRGFFYPQKVYCLFESVHLDFNHFDQEKIKTFASLILLYFHQKNISLDFDHLYYYPDKKTYFPSMIRILSELLNIPAHPTNQSKEHLLIFIPCYSSPHELNQLTLKFLKKGFEKVSFLCFVKIDHFS